MAWAKPNYNENRKSIKSPAVGTTRVRVLPPIHSCANTGKWCIQHKQHFGFDTPKEDGEGKNFNTFYCVEVYDFKTKTVTQGCPECDQLREQKDLLDATKKKLAAKGLSKEEIAKTVEPITNWLSKHNLDSRYYLNVMSPDREFYTIKVAYTVKDKLFKKIEEFRKPTVPGRKPIDAIDAEQGLWFDIIRSGKGLNTEYDVQVVTEPVERDGETFERVKLAPLTEKDAEAAEAGCYDLADVGIRRLDLDKVKRLVESGGDPEVINAIFESSDRRERSRKESSPKPEPKVEVEAKPEPKVTVPEPKVERIEKEPKPEPKVTVPEVDDEEAELLRKLEEKRAKKAAAALVEAAGNKEPVKAAPAVRTENTPSDLTQMSDEELIARFTKKK